MLDINQVCDYIIFRLKSEDEAQLSHLKLQKLLYYVQSWNLAFYDRPFFSGKFQAWIHGPVNRTIYDRFKDSKFIYSPINLSDIINANVTEDISQDAKSHIDVVLEVYAPFTDTDLEIKTHEEEPWIEARNGFAASERCEVELNEETMRRYYAARLNK